jgi:hypothetical protein
MRGAETAGERTIELEFLPRGKVYSCLVEPAGRGLLAGDSLYLAEGEAADPRLHSPGFMQEHALLSVAPDDLGPDFRVLRHFTFILISAETWSGLNQRERSLLSKAAAMGSRLVVYDAGEELKLGMARRAPQPGLLLSSYGFGEVALSAEDLTGLRKYMVMRLRRRLGYAYTLALGGFAEEVGASAQRDLIVRGTLGALNRGHSWLGNLAALPESAGPVNPIWAYDYITRAGLLHPLDVAQLRWYSPAGEAAGGELVARGELESPPLQRYLSNQVSHGSHPYGIALTLYTFLALGLALFFAAYRRSHLLLLLALLALSALATALLVLAGGRAGQPRALVLASSLTYPAAEAGEVRHALYLTSARARELDVGLSAAGFALGHVAPLDFSPVGVTVSGESDVVLQDLQLAPLIPLEIGYSELKAGDPPVSHTWRALREGGRELGLTADEPLSFVFLVAGARALYLGRMEAGQLRSVVLPPTGAEAANAQVRNDTVVAARAYQSFSADRRKNARAAGSAELLNLAYRFLAEAQLHEALRTLVADGRGVTLLGIRGGECRLSLGGEAVSVPRAELVLYRLE